MTTAELLRDLHARDIRLSRDGDRLVYDAPEGAVTEEMLTLFREHKHELLSMLTTSTQQAGPAPLDPDYPCVVCGAVDRWHDVQADLWRCRQCWPPQSASVMGGVDKRYRPDARHLVHAIPVYDEVTTVDRLNIFHGYRCDFPHEGFPRDVALCGAELPRDRNACWVEAPAMTCRRCQAKLPQSLATAARREDVPPAVGTVGTEAPQTPRGQLQLL